MQTESEFVMPADPRDQPGKQWLVIYEDHRGQRTIEARSTIRDAKGVAWGIVDEIAQESEINIEDAYAAGDLWGAWDAVCGGNGSLTIEQVDLPPSAVTAAPHRPPLHRYVVRLHAVRYLVADVPVVAGSSEEAERIAEARAAEPGFNGWAESAISDQEVAACDEADAGPMHPDDMMRRLSMWGGAQTA